MIRKFIGNNSFLGFFILIKYRMKMKVVWIFKVDGFRVDFFWMDFFVFGGVYVFFIG